MKKPRFHVENAKKQKIKANSFRKYSNPDLKYPTSCRFSLVIGQIDDEEFTYLSHYPEIYEPPCTPLTVLLNVIERLSAGIKKEDLWIFPSKVKDNNYIDKLRFTKMKILVGAEIIENQDLVWDGLSLLNNNDNNEHLFTD